MNPIWFVDKQRFPFIYVSRCIRGSGTLVVLYQLGSWNKTGYFSSEIPHWLTGAVIAYKAHLFQD